MHFDVIIETRTPHEKAIEYGKQYLENVTQGDQKMTEEDVNFAITKRL
jgi:hypothetical protein